ncbi:hypothetical protein BH09BAC3_BH09BAC3_24040 [soil metagenome]
MPVIYLRTEIRAPIEKCFDLARSVEVHQISTKRTSERAIAGRTSGLCKLGDTITWEATHFGIRQKLTVEITQFNKPYVFEDRMLKGAFKSMQHVHRFEEKNDITVMTDTFQYEVPGGVLGKLFDGWILKRYMTNFLMIRNDVIKSIAEKAGI